MDCGNLIETKVYSELTFSDRSDAIDFKFITDNEVNKLVMNEWAKLQAEGDTNVKSAIFQSVSELENFHMCYIVVNCSELTFSDSECDEGSAHDGEVENRWPNSRLSRSFFALDIHGLSKECSMHCTRSGNFQQFL